MPPSKLPQRAAAAAATVTDAIVTFAAAAADGKPETEDITPPFVDAFDRAVGDAYQWMFDIATAIYPSTYMHYNASSSPAPLGKDYNPQYVQAITREAERVNANRGPTQKKLKVLPWVWCE